MDKPPSDAPGRLETVRALLNTWRMPKDEPREPVDELAGLAGHPRAWRARLPGVAVPGPGLADLVRLRDDLRAALTEDPQRLQRWLRRRPVRVELGPDGEGVRYVAAPGAVGDALSIVVSALADGTWARLKACPDCRHVFFDHSRNRSRTWCGMYAGGEDGRACGSIAKVRAYRERQHGARR